jgi:hypothetical protein
MTTDPVDEYLDELHTKEKQKHLTRRQRKLKKPYVKPITKVKAKPTPRQIETEDERRLRRYKEVEELD